MDDLAPEFFETMVETVGVGVAIYDADGEYLYVNEAYADLLGVDRSELVGTPLWEVVAGFEEDRFEEYWDSFAEGETRTAETDHRLAGTSVPVMTVTTRRAIDGTPYNFGTIRDVSERKARERELRRQNERLDSFAGVVAHDLRNPLNVAQGYLDLLRDDVDREELDLLDSALSRMETLIEDLLTLAREGDTISETERVSLRETAIEAWESVRTPAADLTLTDDRSLAADRGRLAQLFENLFANAVEHAGSDASVRVGPLPEGFFVEDDGPGIPPGDRDEVFDLGYSTADEGSGFGLAIVEGIAEAHGWTVSVADGEAGGARFEVTGVDVE